MEGTHGLSLAWLLQAWREGIQSKRFSELDLPEVESKDLHQQTKMGDLYCEIDLGGLMHVYPAVLHFGDRTDRKSEFRLQQVQYMLMCYEGVETARDVVIEGPTGLGKTRALFASVIPFLLKDPRRRVIYSTRTITQVNSIMKDLREILVESDKAEDLEGIKASLYIGKDRIINELVKCFEKVDNFDGLVNKNGDPLDTNYCNYGCKYFNHRYRHDRFGNRNPLPLTKPNHPVMDLQELVTNKEYCPLRLMEEFAEDTRILVMPHNYLYDSFWKSQYFRELKDVLLIVDEAHNFLSDAGNKPYLTIGWKVPESRLGVNEDVDEENTTYPEEEFILPEDRQSCTFYIEKMINRIEKSFFQKRESLVIHGVNLLQMFYYAKNLYSELSEKVSQFTKEMVPVLSGFDENGSPSEVFLIAENDMCDLAESLDGGFLGNLIKTNNILEESKTKIEAKTLSFRRRIEPSIYSYSQLVSSLTEIMQNPYQFLLVVDENGTYRFHNLLPEKKASKAITGFHSRIFTSATLSPPEEVAYLLGIPDALNAKIDPVFSDKNYKHFFITGVNSGIKEDSKGLGTCFTSKEKNILEKMFHCVLDAAKGKNIGVFCSSNNAVYDIHNLLNVIARHHNALMMTFISDKVNVDKNKAVKDDYQEICKKLELVGKAKNPNAENIIRAFKRMGDHDQTTLLLSVAGGKLAEGIDYYGKKMEMVIIVGLPYPSLASEIKINKVKENYFFMQRGDRQLGKDLAYKQDAFRKLAQSIGRAHRKMKDRAVVICADERLVGIKNVAENGTNRYEYLSIKNAKKNLTLLQRPLSRIKRNIVFDGHDPVEGRQLQEYISEGICLANDFINFEEMNNQIKEFYRSKE